MAHSLAARDLLPHLLSSIACVNSLELASLARGLKGAWNYTLEPRSNPKWSQRPTNTPTTITEGNPTPTSLPCPYSSQVAKTTGCLLAMSKELSLLCTATPFLGNLSRGWY